MAETAPISPAPQKSRMNRWLAIGLIISVAFNLAFIGWGATRFVKFRSMTEQSSVHFVDRIARKLPDNAARAFRQAVENSRKSQAVSFSDLRRDIASALAAEPYDRARLEALLQEHRNRLDQFQTGIQAGLLAAADAMTPEQRKHYAEHMLRHGPRGERRPR
ncbi:periplasmic heavy metal sensor [uncultured Ferrovibrio sp.]|jgi:uncharacterized membrane protein|uniref:periplasmic heavy metal sensor n=1 Tax=uncultured Ferrovibrio sp. TaxID=1576913 RepID=UPI00261B8A31|nr:periplasmic heavy metal sensor [uncultured Ferrovibrio sp.]